MSFRKENTIDLVLYTEGACVIAQERPYNRVSFFTFYQNKLRNIDKVIAKKVHIDDSLPIENGIHGSIINLLEQYYVRESIPKEWAKNCHRMWR